MGFREELWDEAVGAAIAAQGGGEACEVRVTGARGSRTLSLTLPAACTEEDSAEPLSDASVSSGAVDWRVRVRNRDWTDPTPPREGDALAFPDGREARVRSAVRAHGGWTLLARGGA